MDQLHEQDLSRRGFVIAASTMAACACCSELEAAPSDGGGNRLPPEDPKAPKQIDIGELKDFDKDGVKDNWSRTGRFLVIRDAGKLYAATSICTHKACVLKLKDKAIVCPCHGSKFSNDGIPTSGKATLSLFRYGISVDDKNRIIVDKARQFEEKNWEDEGAFLNVT